MDHYIEQALALPADDLEKLSKNDKSFTFLHNIARFTRDRQVIRDQIMAVLLAGRDTTAATLSWTIYELSHYPAVFNKLRAEILNTVGPSRTPTYEDLKDMKYLTHTLNETLRLYPAVPYNLRAALENTTLPGRVGEPDVGVLKGDIVVYSALSMQRRADIYPPVSDKFPDPAIFSPERWDHWSPKSWTYVPFNGGPRICVGQNFAMTEMAFTRTFIPLLPPPPLPDYPLLFSTLLPDNTILKETDANVKNQSGPSSTEVRQVGVPRRLARAVPQGRDCGSTRTWCARCIL